MVTKNARDVRQKPHYMLVETSDIFITKQILKDVLMGQTPNSISVYKLSSERTAVNTDDLACPEPQCEVLNHKIQALKG